MVEAIFSTRRSYGPLSLNARNPLLHHTIAQCQILLSASTSPDDAVTPPFLPDSDSPATRIVSNRSPSTLAFNATFNSRHASLTDFNYIEFNLETSIAATTVSSTSFRVALRAFAASVELARVNNSAFLESRFDCVLPSPSISPSTPPTLYSSIYFALWCNCFIRDRPSCRTLVFFAARILAQSFDESCVIDNIKGVRLLPRLYRLSFFNRPLGQEFHYHVNCSSSACCLHLVIFGP